METQKIILSIIIPVYNTGKYIGDCLESLLAQDFNDYEIIIVNDGSTDNSMDIVKDISLSYSNIHIFEQENKGQGAARNLGLDHAIGKYIYFMDSDDIVMPDMFNYLIPTLEQKKLDAIFFDGKPFKDIDYDGIETFQESYIRIKNYGEYMNGENLLFDFLNNDDYAAATWLYITRRDILINHKLKFIEGYIHEDELFTMKLFLTIGKCEHVNQQFFLRRIRQGSTMTNAKITQKFDGYFQVFNEFNNILKFYNFSSVKHRNLFKNSVAYIFRVLVTLYKENKNMIDYEKYKKIVTIAQENEFYNFFGKLSVKNYTLYKLMLSLKKIIVM